MSSIAKRGPFTAVLYGSETIAQRPNELFSPASVAKGYMDELKITHPIKKFKEPDYPFGIAMQSYVGGRAECRIRGCEVPALLVDFMSQYPTVNELLGNWSLLTAESISFEDATEEERELLKRITLEQCFNRALWPDFKFYARVKPDKDILPVRTFYNGVTQNVGINYLTSDESMWFAGPDIISAIILSGGKVPHVEKAYRVVAHGQQAGLGTTNLRRMVKVDGKSSFYKNVIEQRAANEANKALHYWLKILANSGSYGLFVELNPNENAKQAEINVFSGEETFPDHPPVIEKAGDWYCPPIGSLITSGGRLLLAMLETTVKNASGLYIFCDTDSLCVVSSKEGGPITIPGAVNGERVLTWAEVDEIVKRFESLNPYNQEIVPGSILKVHKLNWNKEGERRQLHAFSLAAKRYAIYKKKQGGIEIIEPKAHGLGYFHPPQDSPEGWDRDVPKWTFELWDYIVRGALGLERKKPEWFDLSVMMRITLSTPHNALQNLGKSDLTRPHNFMMMPKIAPFGYPNGGKPSNQNFTLITRFTSKREEWLRSECINIHDCDSPTYRLAFDFVDDGVTVSPVNFYQLTESYQNHPEAKSLGPDGKPCEFDTRGLLQRAHIVAGEHIYFGKESDRHWEQGEDISLLESKTIQYKRRGKVTASEEIKSDINSIGIKKCARESNIHRSIIRKIVRGVLVKRSTYREFVQWLQRYKSNVEAMTSS